MPHLPSPHNSGSTTETQHELLQPVPTRAERNWERGFHLAAVALSTVALLHTDPLVLSLIMNEFAGYQACLTRRREKESRLLAISVFSLRLACEPLWKKDKGLAMQLQQLAKKFGVKDLGLHFTDKENDIAWAYDTAGYATGPMQRLQGVGFNGVIVGNPDFAHSDEELTTF